MTYLTSYQRRESADTAFLSPALPPSLPWHSDVPTQPLGFPGDSKSYSPTVMREGATCTNRC